MGWEEEREQRRRRSAGGGAATPAAKAQQRRPERTQVSPLFVAVAAGAVLIPLGRHLGW